MEFPRALGAYMSGIVEAAPAADAEQVELRLKLDVSVCGSK